MERGGKREREGGEDIEIARIVMFFKSLFVIGQIALLLFMDCYSLVDIIVHILFIMSCSSHDNNCTHVCILIKLYNE